jgi:hypothetical protein
MRHSIVLAVILCVLVAAPLHAQTPTPRVTLEPGVNPLTGLASVDADFSTRRPLIVKISNSPPFVRPQAGLNAADHVWESYAEGGVTRFSAVYYGSAPDRVGSIRSFRMIDYELTPMYQAIIAYSGASRAIETLIDVSDISPYLYKGVLFGFPYFYRDDAREAPHNLFMNPNALWELAAEDGVHAPPDVRRDIATYTFSAAPPADETTLTAARIDLTYRATRLAWLYQPETRRYVRETDGIGHYDASTMERVTAANVVVLFARHNDLDVVQTTRGPIAEPTLEIEMWFEGDAYVFRDGVMIPARWQRPTREQNIAFVDESGGAIPFQPGNTWFNVMPLRADFDPAEESFSITP